MEITTELNQKAILLEKEISAERGRLSSDRMDISFGELINLYQSGELIIRPEYQRLYRWNSTQKTALIESILLGIPIPPIFVAEDENGVWELVDGLQRAATIISFFGSLKVDVTQQQNLIAKQENEEIEEDIDEGDISLGNKWKLESGGLLRNLEGFTVDTLPSKYKINMKRASCRVEILRGESNIAMKYELFKRLNSGGSKLTPQEIRNAIYRGIDSTINDLTLELSQNELFIKLTNLSKLKKQELYDQELVLKFIAFLGNIENVTDNTETYLNRFIEESIKKGNFNAVYYRKLFIEVLELIDSLEDKKIFRSANNLFIPAEFEGIMIGIAQNIDFYRSNMELLKRKVTTLKADKEFKAVSGPASNSKSRIKKRLSRANEIFSNPS